MADGMAGLLGMAVHPVETYHQISEASSGQKTRMMTELALGFLPLKTKVPKLPFDMPRPNLGMEVVGADGMVYRIAEKDVPSPEKNGYMRSEGTGDVPPKKNSLPDWLKDRWEAGNNFNKENLPRYPYNEVELEAKEVGSKKFVVDSYVPNKEIVSRKFTQLSEVKESTAISYVRELAQKYSSGSKVSNGPFNPNVLKGGRLKGELILEIPVQNKPIPESVLDEATKNKITIRDINGKEYN